MKPETWEWIDKTEGDRKVARREIQTADPVWNVFCFLALLMLRFSAKKPSFQEKTRFLFVLCTFFLYEPLAQQCAEKYLKGFLEEHNIAFGIGLTETGIGTPQYFRHCNPLSRNKGR